MKHIPTGKRRIDRNNMPIFMEKMNRKKPVINEQCRNTLDLIRRINDLDI